MWALLMYAAVMFSVVNGGVVKMEQSDFRTWDDFEGQNPETPPPSTTEKPDQDGLDWDEEEEYITEPPPEPDMIGQKTIIAIELPHDRFDSVFLRGGYTGSSYFKCEGEASKNMCSIPIRHLVPAGVSAGYTDWSTGDNYLDLIGEEEGQGKHENISAPGTPMRKMEPGAAMSRCNSDQTGKQTKTSRDRTKSTFWLVELDMDCGQTYGYFEVKVVGREKGTGNLWFEREIEGKTGTNRAVDESCVGGIGGDIPYIAESHIGFCGLANIFYYKKSYCEVNKIID